MADIKVSQLASASPLNDWFLVGTTASTTNPSVTYRIRLRTDGLANTIPFRDGSGNFAGNTITANNFSGGSFTGTTVTANTVNASNFIGGTFNGAHVGDGSGLTNLPNTGAGNPTGTIIAFAGATAPAGYLFCDGSQISRSTYLPLFNIISTTYGSGNGSTTFNLPDLRGRVLVCNGSGPGLTPRTLAQQFGAESSTLSLGNIPNHQHRLAPTYSQGLGFWWALGRGYSGWNVSVGTGTTITSNFYFNLQSDTVVGHPGTVSAFTNMQPSIVVNYYIKT